MDKVVLTIIALTLAILFVGCATLPLESNVGKTVSMSKIQDTSVGRFSETRKAFWLFWGAVRFSLPEVDHIVGPAVADHTGVQNLKITTEYGLLDVIVTQLTYGIVHMRTVKIEGEVYD